MSPLPEHVHPSSTSFPTGLIPTVGAAGLPGTPGSGAAPAVVALGGGHGLSASLSALRHLTDRLTAVVTVADDGGSSGRLRRELGGLPPGDLRMALSALCDDSEWGRTWRDVLQHRFTSEGSLHQHATGNLLIATLWELLGDEVAGLDWVGRLLGARGRVLPMAAVPLDIEADVLGLVPGDPGATTSVRGQVAVASTPGQVAAVRLVPEDPPVRPEVVTAIAEADWVVLGPGSWFTSVLPHLMVPGLLRALTSTRARTCVTLNLAVQPGETDGFSAEAHLEVLAAHAPGLVVDAVVADPVAVGDVDALVRVAESLGAQVLLRTVSVGDGTPRHDALRLAAAYRDVFSAPAGHGVGRGGG
ncbi:putative cofD-like protein [Kineococcus radiotolerans]|uniref:Putative gluconeogenesis factor n=1 Tax=Kineococcus radiotolerans TaxID=131568 RepID=A0A7W4XZ53_KINRA|nr:uridine diphosphate-N-acetylglucosamine-binding protein YvcK [Kineococcus radiotolerans]MBB2902929.1 putative cofD-like protein [Kineococcus radiotolerans]